MNVIRKSALLLTLCALAVPTVMAQGRKELRINEVMVVNDSSIVDDFGRHTAWIELINPTHAPINVASIYLTNNQGDKTMYFMPTGDARTKVEKGQTLLLYPDGEPNNGTFHLNFTLTPGQDNFIAIYDADGEALIDSVTIPASLPANASYARTSVHGTEWQVRQNASKADAITPGGANTIAGPNNKVDNFMKNDPHGYVLSLSAMCIVFSALFILALAFWLIKRFIFGEKKSRAGLSAKQSAKGDDQACDPESNTQTLKHSNTQTLDEEVAAAIGMALHQHLNMHDTSASGILTIVHNPASAWSAKAGAMRQLPHK